MNTVCGTSKNFYRKIYDPDGETAPKMYGIVRGASMAGQAGRVDHRDMCSGTPRMEDS